MKCPAYLKGEARKYWAKHAPALVEEGKLHDRLTESFALLCELWGILRSTDPMGDSREALRYVAILKQYQAIAKQFGLLPNLGRGQCADKPADLETILKKMNSDD